MAKQDKKEILNIVLSQRSFNTVPKEKRKKEGKKKRTRKRKSKQRSQEKIQCPRHG